ncbi:MAG: STAS domain-containing protein [Clostridia bacterium]|nr:STAS domain-containing protein [Clostridia bacterium]
MSEKKQVHLRIEREGDQQQFLSITLGGTLTIDHAARVQQVLLQHLDAVQGVRLSIDEADEMDLAFYQLLISLQQTLVKQNKELEATIILDEEKEELFRRAGFEFNF